MFSSLRSRLWLTYAIVVGVVLCVVAVSLVVFLVRNPLVDRQTYLGLERVADIILERKEFIPSRLQNVQQFIQRIDDAYNFRILIYRPDANLIADSQTDGSSIIDSIPSRAFKLSRGKVRDNTGQVWLYVPRVLPNGSFLVVAAPRQGLSLLFSQRLRSLVRDDVFVPLLRAGAIALILALILAFWIARWVSAPLHRMGAAARLITEGEYRIIPLEGPIEVQELAQAFNEMTGRVQASQNSQRDFVANVSHELKTPITSIQGFSQAILDGTVNTPDELKKAAEVIYDESGRMHRMVIDLLDLARFDSGTINLIVVPFDLRELLYGVIAKFSPLAKNAEVDMEIEVDELPRLYGDVDRLSQVFTNLVDNALKHSPRGGRVSVRAKQGIENYMEVTVADTGPGIPSDDLTRVFERFYQVDKSRRGDRNRGVGLGLSIVYEIVQAHNGSITVSHNTPQGCVFVVKLPINHEEY